jgi:FAD/FMN-containing dehydrogenase
MNMPMMHDAALLRLIDQVRTAASDGRALDIRGGDTKSFLGGARRGEPLALREMAGISSYEPTELVVTARAGTLLSELESVLAASGQYLPFDPPRFAPGGTVGGMVAAGLAGPARAAVGGVRDHVLGMTLLDGRGEVVTFGGQVMKNVAGYDISRLMAGSMGILGAILEVSVKVLPRPRAVETIVLDADEDGALALVDAWRSRPLPIHASAWRGGELRVQLAGARAAVQAARAQLGGCSLDAGTAEDDWTKLRDHRHPFFSADPANEPVSLWRLSLPAGTPPLRLAGDTFIEWGGCLRWLRTRESAAAVHAAVQKAGGHAVRWGGGESEAHRQAPMNDTALRLHRQLKRAFDPKGIFNPGRLHPDL